MNLPDTDTRGLDRKAFVAVLVTALCACAALLAMAWALRERTPSPPIAAPGESRLPPAAVDLPPGEVLSYVFNWNGIPAFSAEVRLEERRGPAGTVLVLSYKGRTLEHVSRLWQYHAEGESYLDPVSLLPRRTVITSTAGRKTRRLTMTFDRAEGIATTVTEKLYKHSRSEKKVPFTHGLDMMSAVAFVRSRRLEAGKSFVIEVLLKGKRYAVELTPGAAEPVSVPAGRFQAVPVAVRVRRLGAADEEKAQDRVQARSARIWFSTGDHVPLKAEADALVGKVQGELVKLSGRRAHREP